MVASRFENSLFSRPWTGRTGVYPGQPAAPATAFLPAPPPPMPQVNAPLQVMAGAMPLINPYPQQGAPGEGYGGGGFDPNTTGYGTSPSFGSWASNVLAGLGMVTGPIGAALAAGRIGGTMIADPARTTPYGLNDVFGLLGWGGDDASLADTPGGLAALNANADAYAQGFSGAPDPFGVAGQYGGAFSPEITAIADQMAAQAASEDVGGGGLGASNDATMGGVGQEAGQSLGWRAGGYTGGGADARVQAGAPAGIVHEGEHVLRNAAVRKYGRRTLDALNRNAVPANKLAALAKRYR